MGYVVRIKTGSGMNKSVSQSVVLPNKQRVINFIKRHPMVKSNTNIQVTNTKTKESIIGKPGRFILGRF